MNAWYCALTTVTIVEAAVHTDPRDMDSFETYGFHSSEKVKALLYCTIYQLVHRRGNDIRKAFWLKGGWEGWLQVELCLWLTQAGFYVEREVRVFKNPQQAADMVVQHKNFRGAAIIIELKCESWYQDFDAPGEPDESRQRDDTPLSFQTRIMKDVGKLGDAGSNIIDEYRGIYYCCIGLSVMTTSRDHLHKLEDGGGYFKCYPREMLEELARGQGLIHADQGLVDDDQDGDSWDVQDTDLVIWSSELYQKA